MCLPAQKVAVRDSTWGHSVGSRDPLIYATLLPFPSAPLEARQMHTGSKPPYIYIYIYIYIHICAYTYTYYCFCLFSRRRTICIASCKPPPTKVDTPNLPTNIAGFRGFDSVILILRGGIPRPIGNLQESLSQAILIGMIFSREIGRTRACEWRPTAPIITP